MVAAVLQGTEPAPARSQQRSAGAEQGTVAPAHRKELCSLQPEDSTWVK